MSNNVPSKMGNVSMNSTWSPAAPGQVMANTYMHAPGSGSTTVGQTASGHDIGQHKTHTHSMPKEHFAKPQHDSAFDGTTSWAPGSGKTTVGRDASGSDYSI